MAVVELSGGGHELKDAAALLAAGFDGGQQHLGEATDLCALSAEAELASDDGRTECVFAGIVGGLDAFLIEEHPQPVAVLKQILTGDRGLRVATSPFAEQQSFDLGVYGGRAGFGPVRVDPGRVRS